MVINGTQIFKVTLSGFNKFVKGRPWTIPIYNIGLEERSGIQNES